MSENNAGDDNIKLPNKQGVSSTSLLCRWKLHPGDKELYTTSCAHYFELKQKTLTDSNDIIFCCFCGKVINLSIRT